MVSSPTSRSLKKLRDDGYLAEVVEQYNYFAKKRKDLFEFIDILAIKDGVVLGVQTTSYSNVSARKTKILESEAWGRVVAANIKVVIHGWHKKANRWVCREVDLTPDD